MNIAQWHVSEPVVGIQGLSGPSTLVPPAKTMAHITRARWMSLFLAWPSVPGKDAAPPPPTLRRLSGGNKCRDLSEIYRICKSCLLPLNNKYCYWETFPTVSQLSVNFPLTTPPPPPSPPPPPPPRAVNSRGIPCRRDSATPEGRLNWVGRDQPPTPTNSGAGAVYIPMTSLAGLADVTR